MPASDRYKSLIYITLKRPVTFNIDTIVKARTTCPRPKDKWRYVRHREFRFTIWKNLISNGFVSLKSSVENLTESHTILGF